MFVAGTAGHVDHGKSLLVKALTGIDPDRLPQEKERGMTLDLGFAWLKLPSGRELSLVDVPGHERFVGNMLAGVGSIDLALLVIAADEGVMPQTREHLAILDLLRVNKGIVVLTKKDLVDNEWLELVASDVKKLLQGTALSQAPIVAVSSVTGEGLPALVSAIDSLLTTLPPKKDTGKPRLPIDRIFTVIGFGTVVTGTLIDGSLSQGQEVEIQPRGLKSRLRGLQTHKRKVEKAQPGSRVAANLVGLATEQLKRGDVLSIPGCLVPTTAIDATLRLLSNLTRPLTHNAPVAFYTGTSEVMAKVRLLDKEKLPPGETGWVQLLLVKPIAVVKGDLFVLRSTNETLGGGEIVDVHPTKHRRFQPALIQNLESREKGSIADMVLAGLQTRQPLELGALLAQVDSPPAEANAAIEALSSQKEIILLGGKGPKAIVFSASGWTRLTEEVKQLVQAYHRQYPLRRGIPKEELRSRLKLSVSAFAEVLKRIIEEEVVVEEGTAMRLPPFQNQPNPEQQATINSFLESLARNPYAPPSDALPPPEVLNWLIERRLVVRVSEGIVFAVPAYEQMVKQVIDYIKSHGKITVAEVRDLFGTSRKYVLALMEHLDEQKITRRVGDERVLR